MLQTGIVNFLSKVKSRIVPILYARQFINILRIYTHGRKWWVITLYLVQDSSLFTIVIMINCRINFRVKCNFIDRLAQSSLEHHGSGNSFERRSIWWAWRICGLNRRSLSLRKIDSWFSEVDCAQLTWNLVMRIFLKLCIYVNAWRVERSARTELCCGLIEVFGRIIINLLLVWKIMIGI